MSVKDMIDILMEYDEDLEILVENELGSPNPVARIELINDKIVIF